MNYWPRSIRPKRATHRPPEHSPGRGAGGAISNDAVSTLTVEHSDFTGNRASAAVTSDAGRESGQGRDGNPILMPSNAVRRRSERPGDSAFLG
jgi:hypothetical protein